MLLRSNIISAHRFCLLSSSSARTRRAGLWKPANSPLASPVEGDAVRDHRPCRPAILRILLLDVCLDFLEKKKHEVDLCASLKCLYHVPAGLRSDQDSQSPHYSITLCDEECRCPTLAFYSFVRLSNTGCYTLKTRSMRQSALPCSFIKMNDESSKFLRIFWSALCM